MSKLDGIDAGRYRFTFEGEYKEGGWFSPDGTDAEWHITYSEACAETFQITRIEPALAIGDEVTILGKHKGKVLGFLSNGNVAVEYQAGDTSWCGPYHPSCLTHA